MRSSLVYLVLVIAGVACKNDSPTGGGTIDAPGGGTIDAPGGGGTADAAIDATVMMVTCTANQNCRCNAGETCDLSCPNGGCQIQCQEGAVCTISCAGGNCQIDCRDNSRCAIDCAGGNCPVSADPGASIDVNCGGPGGCDQQCDMGTQCGQTCTMGCTLDCGGSTMCSQTCTSGCTCTGC